MNKGRLISLALPVLLSASGLAVAKGGSQATAGNATKDETSVAAPRSAPNAGNPKVDNRSAKSNVSPSTDTEGTQDPYAVPLFKDARPLRTAK